jgi:hypothetical protein
MNLIGKAVTAFYGARAALARMNYSANGKSNETADKLAADGVVILPRALPQDKLAAVQALNRGRFERANAKNVLYSPDGVKLEEGADVSEERFGQYYFLLAKNYPRELDFYGLVDPIVRPILSSYYRSFYYYRELDCYRSQATPVEFQGSYAWHRDNYPPGSLKVMVYLTDVTSEADGPLVVAKGSHRGFAPELGHYGPRVPREEVEGKLELVSCLGPAGTVIVFNNNAVHRASNPKRGHREVLNALILPCITDRRREILGSDLSPKGFLSKYTR